MDYTLNVTGDELQQLITKLKNGEFTGKDGADGTTPHIGENGNWYLGELDTGVKASDNISEGAIEYSNSYRIRKRRQKNICWSDTLERRETTREVPKYNYNYCNTNTTWL